MNELKHHGILKQRWGVRRFQNPDGSLTEEGKKRYSKLSNKDGKPNSSTYKKVSAKELTDEEIAAANKRMSQEKTYNQLVKDTNPKTSAEKTKQFLSEVARESAKKILTNALVSAGNLAIQKLIGKKPATSRPTT